MAAHRYWRLDSFTGGAGGYISGAEAYLRQTVGGTNEVPTASSGSTPYSSSQTVLYDGDPATWWATNAAGWFVAFDYGANIDPVELFWQNRPDYGIQSPTGMTLSWSDTGLTGPWTVKSYFSFGSSWSTNGQTQTVSTLLPPGERVTEQHGYAALLSSGEFVTEQHGFAVLQNFGQFVTEQHGYAVLVKSANSRRRQVLLGSI